MPLRLRIYERLRIRKDRLDLTNEALAELTEEPGKSALSADYVQSLLSGKVLLKQRRGRENGYTRLDRALTRAENEGRYDATHEGAASLSNAA